DADRCEAGTVHQPCDGARNFSARRVQNSDQEQRQRNELEYDVDRKEQSGPQGNSLEWRRGLSAQGPYPAQYSCKAQNQRADTPLDRLINAECNTSVTYGDAE